MLVYSNIIVHEHIECSMFVPHTHGNKILIVVTNFQTVGFHYVLLGNKDLVFCFSHSTLSTISTSSEIKAISRSL